MEEQDKLTCLSRVSVERNDRGRSGGSPADGVPRYNSSPPSSSRACTHARFEGQNIDSREHLQYTGSSNDTGCTLRPRQLERFLLPTLFGYGMESPNVLSGEIVLVRLHK